MKQLAEINLSNQELRLIKDNSEIDCYHCGSKSYQKNGSTRGNKKYRCKNCKRYFLEEKNISGKYLQGLPLGEDVWHADELGLRVNKHRNEPKLIFVNIKQEWLKDSVKKFVRYSANNKELKTLKYFITSINTFSEFIEQYPSLAWETLDRSIIIDYLAYLSSKQISWRTKQRKITHLKQLLETGKINSWFNISSYLVRPEDYPKNQKRLP